jgi:hypothetical protein
MFIWAAYKYVPTSTMKTRSGNKQGPSGDIMPRRSKRASPPSTPDPQTEATATRSTKGRKVEPAKKKKRTKLVTPNGKSQTPLAKLRSRSGCDTGVQSEEDSETSKVAKTKEARMPGAKARSNGDVRRNKVIKMVAGYKSTNSVRDNGDETTSQNVANLSGRETKALLRQFHDDDDDDDDSIPDSVFPGWV